MKWPLLPYESCNLGSINLSIMTYREGNEITIDYTKLTNTVRTAVRFLDNVIEVNAYPLPEIEKTTKANRKIGLGVMGFADMLIELGIPYDSKEALKIANDIMSHIRHEAKITSSLLATERGSFQNYHASVYKKRGGPELRNATLTSIAPTGSISPDCRMLLWNRTCLRSFA